MGAGAAILNLMFTKYDKWYIIGKLMWSTFRICKKNWKFTKTKIFSTKSSYKVKIFAKKCPKTDKIYIFEKPLTMLYQICKNVCKILNILMFNWKTKNVQIFKNFFAKLVYSVSLCHRLSKKLKIINIWQLKVGQNKD